MFRKLLEKTRPVLYAVIAIGYLVMGIATFTHHIIGEVDVNGDSYLSWALDIIILGPLAFNFWPIYWIIQILP